MMCVVPRCSGQGTVMTGTVLSGSARVGDTVEIPALALEKKIKSMQSFKKPVDSAMQGDRVALCVTQLDSSLLERGVVCAPGTSKCVTMRLLFGCCWLTHDLMCYMCLCSSISGGCDCVGAKDPLLQESLQLPFKVSHFYWS